jgi:aldehyde dehydrogenase (NAD+)
LNKPAHEVQLEIGLLYSEIKHARRHLSRWASRRPVTTPMIGQPGSSWVQPEPLGVVLIMSAWNYPIQLLFGPLIPALAAGNAVLLKPSEIAAHNSTLIADLVPEYLDQQAVRVVEGAVEETTALLKLRYDHIFYTGGAAVGRIVMRAAAEHLTPVTLELGGKSPCVIDRGADLASAARRVLWGKTLNAGQTCIAPDYVLVHPEDRQGLIAAMRDELEAMYGADRLHSQDYCKIINRRHFERLTGYLSAGEIAIGGRTDEDAERIEPTVITGVGEDDPIMQEEIFGPILPVLDSPSLSASIDFIRRREKPLAAYLFTRDSDSEAQFVEQVSAGSMLINDVIFFMSVPDLPFGGVGESGMGCYHGQAGFDRLSHLKAVMRRARWPEITIRFAPYTSFKTRVLKWLS